MGTEEDAALVDSFFLPGGILDPEDEDDTPVPSVPPILGHNGGIGRVPSNPWRDDCVPVAVTETIRTNSAGSSLPIAGLAVASTQQQPTLNESLFHPHQAAAPSIRPPPGYTEKDRNVPEILAQKAENVVSAIGQRIIASDVQLLNSSPFPIINTPLLGGEHRQKELQTATNTPPRQLLDRTIQRPTPPRTKTEPYRWADDNQADHSHDDKQNNTPQSQQHNISPSPNNRSPMHTQQQQEQQQLQHDQQRQEDLLVASKSSRILDFSLPTALLKDKDPGPWNDADESECVRSNSSIPLELLSVHGIYRGDSLTSSLSASTCGEGTSHDAGEEETEGEGDVDDVDDKKEESEGSDDQLEENDERHCFHERAPDHDHDQDLKCNLDDSTAKNQSASPNENNPSQSKWDPWNAVRIALYRVCISAQLVFLSMLRFSANIFNSATAPITKLTQRIQPTAVARLKTTKERVVGAYETTFQCWSDTRQAASTLLIQLYHIIRTMFATIANTLKLVLGILLQIWKYSLFEAIEEPNVSICYCIFSFMPSFCTLLMNFYNLPHWAPHLLTAVAVYSLCRQVKVGALYLDASTILNETSDIRYVKKRPRDAKVSGGGGGGGGAGETKQPKDERACKTILHVLKLVLPIFFLVDGFSTEFGTIMGVSDASRLTTAFMMSLVRKNLVSSPIGWISWAIQVLVATYFPSSGVADHVVLIVGLSSIRLIRYLDFQRFINEEKRGRKSN